MGALMTSRVVENLIISNRYAVSPLLRTTPSLTQFTVMGLVEGRNMSLGQPSGGDSLRTYMV